MPIVGTSARLYFPNESSEEAIITGCVRKNGSSCSKTANTTKRYFGTENGKYYYLNSDGEMATGWMEQGGKEYYFDSNGKMKKMKFYIMMVKFIVLKVMVHLIKGIIIIQMM